MLCTFTWKTRILGCRSSAGKKGKWKGKFWLSAAPVMFKNISSKVKTTIRQQMGTRGATEGEGVLWGRPAEARAHLTALSREPTAHLTTGTFQRTENRELQKPVRGK